MERAYKRRCFQDRGALARWVDRAFFSALGGGCLYIACGSLCLSAILALGLLSLFVLWDGKRWRRCKTQLWQDAARQLRREAWLREEAARIRKTGGTILYPAPDRDGLIGCCLKEGPGAAFHCFGEAQEPLIIQAQALGCSLIFHPWGEGEEPTMMQVEERLRRDAPKRDARLWRQLLRLPGNRYLLAGTALLLLSLVLKRALYWRLLGSLCLLIGALRRSLRLITET